jgi:hypothetical protein
VTRNYAAEGAKKTHACRRDVQPREKLREPKPDLAVKIKIENSFDLAPLVSRFRSGRGFDDLHRH